MYYCAEAPESRRGRRGRLVTEGHEGQIGRLIGSFTTICLFKSVYTVGLRHDKSPVLYNWNFAQYKNFLQKTDFKQLKEKVLFAYEMQLKEIREGSKQNFNSVKRKSISWIQSHTKQVYYCKGHSSVHVWPHTTREGMGSPPLTPWWRCPCPCTCSRAPLPTQPAMLFERWHNIYKGSLVSECKQANN